LNDTHEESAIAFANFAHSYCSSAIVLQHAEIDTTHPNSVVTYLFYHSIELYLKAYLMSHGISAQKLRQSYGHKIGKLSRKASALGLSFSEFDDEIFEFMTSSNTVISARYIRLGHHKRFPPDILQITCKKLHDQVIKKVYDQAGIDRRPSLSIHLSN
jgi:hypothetical protein